MAFRSVVTLSRRESEVAELVRDGLTNREIANRLFISERTVEGHVAQICNKLGVRSRIQIATQMLEDDDRAANVLTSRPRPFRVVSRRLQPPWGVLAAMGFGAPLAVVAGLYPWVGPEASTRTISLKIFVTCLALIFLIIPIVAVTGLWSGRPWAEPLAIGGLLAAGSVVLLAVVTDLALSALRGHPFQPADTIELAYAIAAVPLLVVHLAAAGAWFRRGSRARVLTTTAAVFWIIRYGYGLSLGALVLWLIWRDQRSGPSAHK